MATLRRLVFVELVAVGSLLLVAGAMAAYGAVDSVRHANSLIDPWGSAWLGFAYTVAFGLLPVVLFGAPVYSVLLSRGKASWPTAVGLGVVPGLLLLLVAGGLGVWAIVCGLVASCLTHLVCRRLGPNNSFKPTPLRGAA